MKELKLVLEKSGFAKVQTYIQSGNIVVQASKRPDKEIGTLIQSNFGLTTKVLVLSEAEFNSAMAANPYPHYEGKLVHFYFCQETPEIVADRLTKLTAATERHQLLGKVFYLHAPEGIGRSRLVANIDSCLGVSATGRNLNTINKLDEIIQNA